MERAAYVQRISRLASRTARVMAVTISAVLLFVLSAPLARAGTYSAAATVGPGPQDITCSGTSGAGAGGIGFASVTIGPVGCSYMDQLGRTISSSGFVSGSWVTGDFSVSSQANATPVGASIFPLSTGNFSVDGPITLPSGLASAPITFGLTGLSGIADGLGVAGYFSGGAVIELTMIAGGSSGTRSTSTACLSLNMYLGSLFPSCPVVGGLGYFGGLGPGDLAPVTLIVSDGEDLQLEVLVEALSGANAYYSNSVGYGAVTVDPLYLTLPAGATFDSGITGFLSGASSPEPGSVLLFGTGLLGLCVLRRQRA